MNSLAGIYSWFRGANYIYTNKEGKKERWKERIRGETASPLIHLICRDFQYFIDDVYNTVGSLKVGGGNRRCSIYSDDPVIYLDR